MRLFYKFYDANEDGGGAGAAPATEIFTPELKAELETLRTFKSQIADKKPELTPEQLNKEAEVEKVNFRKYSVENDLMKDDDFSRFETVKGKKDAELVFEDFSNQWDTDNPDATPETKESEKKLAFETQYHINSDNKTLKGRGEKILAKEASEIRNPLENSYKTAKERYDESKTINGEVPGFNKWMDEVIKEATPDKLVFKTKEGEDEVEADVELTEDQKKEIDKIFRNVKNFQSFVTNKDKRDDFKKSLAKKIDGFIKINNWDKMNQSSYDKGKGVGMKNGSNIGADQPFGLVKDIHHKSSTENTSTMKEIFDSFDKVRDKTA